MLTSSIQENKELKPFNTFGIAATARYFAAFSTVEQLKELLIYSHQAGQQNLLVLGGGSNMLFTQNYNGLVIKNELKGIELVKEDANHYYIKAWGGENWHRFVQYCIQHNYAGLENLSLIPGCVGASPMQNIGAYGVEIKDVCESLEALHIESQSVVTFHHTECNFGYRESVFKNKYKGQFIILNVTYRLNKQPVYHTSYGAIEQELAAMGSQQLNIAAIAQAVINIRSSKLPNPAEVGNAGSFFKNPTIPQTQFRALQQQHATIPHYAVAPDSNGQAWEKIPAAWLIEQCGWKGYRKGDAGCHSKQPLVLVNYANATGNEIFQLSEEIISSVNQQFGITLEREVNII
ncbi:UDP-N-acetylmuramate dehydrogenase [Filimonas lacunae]|nr:UDP-N-acetylmuramate dehydrogenase [Filimonas lacunae]BAV05258.1 UDP-N-acetylenolpyruvoylglucosamine reductase [Filimonas lacunae]